MKIYRWYSETICMGGITAAHEEKSVEDVKSEVDGYIRDTFNDMKFISKYVKDPQLSVWATEDDDDYNDCYPATIATNY